MTKPKNKTRRDLLLGLAGLGAVAWGWQRYLDRQIEPSFSPLPGLPGWRQLDTGTVSAGSPGDAVFLGIGESAPAPLPAENLCDLLYATPGRGLPVAVFTDINCPNCRSLESKLATRRDALAITWLQLPLLGPQSEAAARAAIAAEVLSGRPGEPATALRGTGLLPVIRYHARRAGLEETAVAKAMEAPEVTAILERQIAAAETLGIYGTPAMTIGKTLVMGDVPLATLDRLLTMDHPVCA